MFRKWFLLELSAGLAVCIAAATTDAVAQGPLAQPWPEAYSGANSNGPQVIGHWRFETGDVTKDAERLTWIREEKSPAVSITVRNLQAAPLKNATLSLSGTAHAMDLIDVPNLEPGESHVFTKPFNTSLRPDDYEFTARLTVPGDPPIQRDEFLQLKLVPRPLPQRMPVMMWGIGSPAEFARELPRLLRILARRSVPHAAPRAIAARSDL